MNIALIATDTAGSIEMSALTVTIIVSTIVPILTGIITKANLIGWAKGLVTIALNAVNALIVTATVADGTALISQETFIAWALGVVISVAMYAGVYESAGLTSSRNGGKLFPESGIGPGDHESLQREA